MLSRENRSHFHMFLDHFEVNIYSLFRHMLRICSVKLISDYQFYQNPLYASASANLGKADAYNKLNSCTLSVGHIWDEKLKNVSLLPIRYASSVGLMSKSWPKFKCKQFWYGNSWYTAQNHRFHRQECPGFWCLNFVVFIVLLGHDAEPT